MQKNRLLILFLVLFFTLGAIWWLTRRKASEPTGVGPPLATAQGSSNSPQVLALIVPSNGLDGIRQRDEERLKLDSARWWKTPVSFYGRAIDQNGEPVSQADVKFELNDTSVKGTTDYYAKSDANGFFSLTGVKGKNLSVYITKTGYYQSRAENNSFDYYDIASGNQYKSDGRHPEEFHLRKGGEKVPLIKSELQVHAKLGETVIVDLLNGRTNSPNGQLQVELLANEPFRRGANGTWSMRVSANEAGIQFQTEEFPFMAPESGYQPSIDLGLNSEKPPTWKDSGYVGGAFYLKTHSGYVSAKIQAVPGKSSFRLSYYWNPSGSRNLEPDTALLFNDLESYNRYIAAHPQAAK